MKRCIVCEGEAVYKIKDTSDYYCTECAHENFADLNLLLKVEEEVRLLKEALKEKMGELNEKEEILDKMIKITEKAGKTEKKDSEKDSDPVNSDN